MISDIIEGHINELINKNDKMREERLLICKKCPLGKNTSLGLICDSSKWINAKTGAISESPKTGYIRGCGCRLNAKTRLEHNHCIINRW